MTKYVSNLQESVMITITHQSIPCKLETMKIALLFDDENEIIAAEIKADRHRGWASQKNYRETYRPASAIRLSERHSWFEDGLFSASLYAIFCI